MFEGISHWHWFILAIALAGMEVMSMSMYLVSPACAAAIVGLVKMMFPETSLFVSLCLFAILTIVFTVVARYFLRNVKEGAKETGLDAVGNDYVGRIFTLESDVVDGKGRVKVGDGAWNARGEDAVAGTKIKVTGVQGNSLLYELVD